LEEKHSSPKLLGCSKSRKFIAINTLKKKKYFKSITLFTLQRIRERGAKK
jgi:hypothetical protein